MEWIYSHAELPGAKKGPTIESFILEVIQAHRGKMAFQEVLATIQ